jgi:5-formyltetrahydrofolate cyclo-ligase
MDGHDPSRSGNERKTELRERMRDARRSLSAERRMLANSAISERARHLPELTRARAILAYEPMPEEVDPTRLLARLRAAGVRVALPRIAAPRVLSLHWVAEGDALVSGSLGIREPLLDSPLADLREIDAVIVPGVAFDASCCRLGFGGGFYDQLLCELPENVPRISLAFDEQLVEEVPMEEHDIGVDLVVTPTRTLRRRS